MAETNVGSADVLAIDMLAVVALLRDLPEQGLLRGQAGTVVDLLSPKVAYVEFADTHGRTYALVPLPVEDLLVLHYDPVPQVA